MRAVGELNRHTLSVGSNTGLISVSLSVDGMEPAEKRVFRFLEYAPPASAGRFRRLYGSCGISASGSRCFGFQPSSRLAFSPLSRWSSP